MDAANMRSYFFEDIEIGMAASLTNAVSEADIMAFASVTGDNNPVHLDADYAATTIFKERIAHGMLTAGYISAVFGTKLPGPGAIYISQTLNFRGPVKIGAQVVTRVMVEELFPTKRRVLFSCLCSIKDKPVLQGEAMLMVPPRPE